MTINIEGGYELSIIHMGGPLYHLKVKQYGKEVLGKDIKLDVSQSISDAVKDSYNLSDKVGESVETVINQIGKKPR